MKKVDAQEVNRVARQRTVAQLVRRGFKKVMEARDLNRTVLKAETPSGRFATLIVKAKTSGSWQATIADGEVSKIRKDVTWIFVDLAGGPDYFVARDDWVRRDIDDAHQKYLRRHGGHRARNDASLHHAIHPVRVSEWKDRWDVIGG